MTTIALYTATENELGGIQRAAGRLDAIDLAVRSESDLADGTDVDEFVDEIAAEDATAAVFWLHGAEDSMPGYDHAVERLRDAGIPLVVKSTGDAFAFEDTSVAESDRDRAYDYLKKGGAVNVANLCRFLADEYAGRDSDFDPEDPVELPTEGVYHPDHPGAEYADLRKDLDSEKPTVGVWFYESHWTHENTRYVDALVREIEAEGANALPVFCNPATDTDEQEDAEWVVDEWFTDERGEPMVDAVLSSFMF